MFSLRNASSIFFVRLPVGCACKDATFLIFKCDFQNEFQTHTNPLRFLHYGPPLRPKLGQLFTRTSFLDKDASQNSFNLRLVETLILINLLLEIMLNIGPPISVIYMLLESSTR